MLVLAWTWWFTSLDPGPVLVMQAVAALPLTERERGASFQFHRWLRGASQTHFASAQVLQDCCLALQFARCLSNAADIFSAFVRVAIRKVQTILVRRFVFSCAAVSGLRQ